MQTSWVLLSGSHITFKKISQYDIYHDIVPEMCISHEIELQVEVVRMYTLFKLMTYLH